MQAQHLDLLIEMKDGVPRKEPLHVQPLPSGRYVLLHSPGFVLGLAGGDEFELISPDGAFKVTKHGGNLAIQLFSEDSITNYLSQISRIAESLGGVLDGNISQGAVLTIPVTTGFPAIEAALNAFVLTAPSCSWYYGNVYSTVDGTTPLLWWANA